MRALLLATAVFLLTTPLMAQYGSASVDGHGSESGASATASPMLPYGGSGAAADAASPQPAVASGESSGSKEQDKATSYPYNLRLLATRHFDFLVWPKGKATPGSMEDTSISLGEYARRLRAEKRKATQPEQKAPGAMAQPAEPQ